MPCFVVACLDDSLDAQLHRLLSFFKRALYNCCSLAFTVFAMVHSLDAEEQKQKRQRRRLDKYLNGCCIYDECTFIQRGALDPWRSTYNFPPTALDKINCHPLNGRLCVLCFFTLYTSHIHLSAAKEPRHSTLQTWVGLLDGNPISRLDL